MGLAERLALVSTGSVIEVVGMLSLHADVVNKRDVTDLDLLQGPVYTQKPTVNNHSSTRISTASPLGDKVLTTFRTISLQ